MGSADLLTKEQLEELDRRIGARADKLISDVTTKLVKAPSCNGGGPDPAFFFNAVQPEMCEVLVELDGTYPLWVDDVLQGVARLDWYRSDERSIPLSARNLLLIFASLGKVSPYTVSHLLRVGERQARRYYRAAEFAHVKLIEGFCKDETRSMKYPETFIYPTRDVPQSDQKEDYLCSRK